MFAAANAMRAHHAAAGGGPALTLDFTGASLDARLTFTRASSATRVNSSGTIVSATTDAVRWDYAPVSHALLGLLIEEARTNDATWSEDFVSHWNKGGVNQSADTATAPDGNTTADSVGEDSSSGEHVYGSVGASGARVESLFLKQRSGTRKATLRSNTLSVAYASFNLSDGSLAAHSGGEYVAAPAAQAFGSSWYRCSMAVNYSTSREMWFGSSTDGTTASYAGDGASGFYAWGAQYEAGAFPTSYIPTTSASATRAADVCTSTHADVTGWLGQAAKSVVVSADCPASGTRRVFHAAKVGSESTDYISIYASAASIKAKVVSGGTTQADLTSSVSAVAGTAFKAALRLGANDVQFSVNGEAAVTDSSATIPACDKLWLGCSPTSGEELCGHLSGAWDFYVSLENVATRSV